MIEPCREESRAPFFFFPLHDYTMKRVIMKGNVHDPAAKSFLSARNARKESEYGEWLDKIAPAGH